MLIAFSLMVILSLKNTKSTGTRAKEVDRRYGHTCISRFKSHAIHVFLQQKIFNNIYYPYDYEEYGILLYGYVLL